jgi:serine/threonine-protein kinase
VLYVLLGGSVNRRSDPLTAISTGVGAASDAARASADAAARAFARDLRGDLDAIVRTATRLEPQRRYASVQLLEQDLHAWLAGRPVAARGGDRWYAFGKFVRRHRAMLSLGAASLVAAVAFMVQLAVERDRAREAEAAAEQEAATTREVLAFVTGLFEELDPNRGGHAGITAFELLERGRDRIDDVRATSPAARGRLLRTLGEIYRAGERPQPALELLEKSYGQLLEARAPEIELAMVEIKIAEAWNLLGDGTRAGEYIDRVLARQALIDADPALEAKARMTAGVSLQMRGRSDDAVVSFERARTLFSALGESGREGLASVLHNRGWLAGALGDPAGAMDWFGQAEQAKRELLGGDHPSTLNTRLSAVVMLSQLGRHAEAERTLLEMLPDVEHRVGATSGYAGRIWNELGSARQDLGRYVDAAEAYRRALRILGPYDDGAPNALVARVVNNLASLDEDRGDLVAAEAGYRQSLAWRERNQAADSTAVARARHNLARTLLRRGAHAEAATLAASARAIRDAQLPPSSAERLASQALAVELLLALGDDAGAQREAQALATASVGVELPTRPAASVQRALARAAAARGDAAARRIASEAAHAALRAGLPANHPMVALAELDLADAIVADDPARARQLRAGARAILDAALAPESPDRKRLVND